MHWVKDDADSRQEAIEDALRKAFSSFIEKREVEVIVISSMTAFDLAKAIINHPRILKPLLAACNIAARAIERDLSIKNMDTYSPRLSDDQAKVIAGYIKPFLPSYLEIPSSAKLIELPSWTKKFEWGKDAGRKESSKVLINLVVYSFTNDCS